jgi:F0F1-type ATP synthase membrane subunit b/b'
MKEHRRSSLSRDVSAQLNESNRQRARLEEEVRLYEEKVKAMRLQMDVMVSTPRRRRHMFSRN